MLTYLAWCQALFHSFSDNVVISLAELSMPFHTKPFCLFLRHHSNANPTMETPGKEPFASLPYVFNRNLTRSSPKRNVLKLFYALSLLPPPQPCADYSL